MPDHTIEKVSVEERAHNYAWNWFAYHADQRNSIIKFYLTAIAAIGLGVGSAFVVKQYFLTACLAALGATVSVLFWRLDVRNKHLIKIAEDALRKSEGRMSSVVFDDSMRLTDHAESREFKPTILGSSSYVYRGVYSFSQIYSVMFYIVFVVSFAFCEIMVLLMLFPPNDG
jgi:hypothetical protein